MYLICIAWCKIFSHIHSKMIKNVYYYSKEKEEKAKKKKKNDRRKATIRFSRHERIDATLLSRLPRILRQEPGLETTLIFVVNSYQVEWRRQYTRTHRTMPHICDPWWSHPSWNLLRHVFPRGWMPFREDVWGWGCSKPILNSWSRRLSLESIWMHVSFLGCDLIVKLWIKGDKEIFILCCYCAKGVGIRGLNRQTKEWKNEEFYFLNLENL